MRSLKKLKANGRLALDTNAVIAYREGIPSICTIMDNIDILFLPVIVLGELRYGAINSARPEQNEQVIKKLLENSVLMHVDEAVAGRYARVRSDLRKKGQPIPENDIWIAAICLENETPLISSDGHFENINGLEVLKWKK